MAQRKERSRSRRRQETAEGEQKGMVDVVLDTAKGLIGNALPTLISATVVNGKEKLFDDPRSFENATLACKRLVVVGCTGAGKSCMLNIMAGWKFEIVEDADGSFTTTLYKSKKIDGQISDIKSPIFLPGDSAESTTKHTAFALIDYFNNPEKPLMVIDTPGHDDTSTSSGDVSELAKIEGDLHNKMKMLGHVNAILVIHNDIKSNRLNPMTLELLKKIDTKFKDSGSDVWDHVIIGYSKCNVHQKDWRADLDRKKREMQEAIKKNIPTCKKDVPIVPLGGITGEPPVGRADQNNGYEVVWEFVNSRKNLSTKNLQPFKGIAEQHRDAVLRADEERAKRIMLETYMEVMGKVALLLAFFFVRNGLLPWWLSIFLFNFASMLDELLILSIFLWAVGTREVLGSLKIFNETWVGLSFEKTLPGAWEKIAAYSKRVATNASQKDKKK